MMVKGIGVDLVDIRRFVPRKEEYAQKILTDAEYRQFLELTLVRQIEYLAGRFCVKEAYYKAARSRSLGYKDIEVLNDVMGVPAINVPNVQLSISHEHDYAVAFVIINE
jgi:holo-[acyl-carrier protein] synthase